MNTFITKLHMSANIDKINDELNAIIYHHTEWGSDNQIGLRHRINCQNQWKDSIGGLVDRKTRQRLAYEKDFSEWNTGTPTFTKIVLSELAEKEKIILGRVRFMRLQPKFGLSMHIDYEPRYHLVLQTNKSAVFGECFTDNTVRAMCYHIPADNNWYKIDTTREHFVYNGGWTPRIHLVVCPAV